MYADQSDWLAWLAENGPGVFVACLVVAFIVLLILLVVKLWKPLTRFVLSINAVLDLPETLAAHGVHFATIDLQLKEIKHEVLPNSGGSMRDEVNRQGVLLKAMDDHTRTNSRRLSRVETALELTSPVEAVVRARNRRKT